MVPLKTGKLDQMLLITVLVLEISGLVILYSASAYNGRVRFSDAGYYLKKQLFAAVLGFGCMWLISRMDYHKMAQFATLAYILSMALSGAVLLVGDAYNGSRRWLSVGPLSFQPSEVAKIAVIVCLSYMIVNMGRNIKTLKAFMILAGSGSALRFLRGS